MLALAPLAGLAADPQPLQAQQTGRLTGNRGGAFATYRFLYPGEGDVALELRVQQAGVPESAVGVRLYGPSGEVTDRKPRERGEHLVQVYNYDPLLTADYTLTAAGLPTATATPTGRPTPPPTPTAEAGADEPLKGTLPRGGTQGQFALFEFDHPGDGSAYRIALHVTPDRRDVLDMTGFKLYDQHGKLVLTGGAQPGRKPNVVEEFSTRVAGSYVVQVYNYGDLPIEYEVSLQAP